MFFRTGFIAILLAACAAAQASAADLSADGYHEGRYARPAGMIAVYDYEPGVVIRAYWLPPLGHRHYFPATGKKPRLGRVENISQRGRYEPAQDFYRSWSNDSAFPDERRVHSRSRDKRDDESLDPDPRMTPELK